eukprot:COSAG01_NODE_23310_length_820_cov_0.785021_1_plen_42_part_10
MQPSPEVEATPQEKAATSAAAAAATREQDRNSRLLRADRLAE